MAPQLAAVMVRSLCKHIWPVVVLFLKLNKHHAGVVHLHISRVCDTYAVQSAVYTGHIIQTCRTSNQPTCDPASQEIIGHEHESQDVPHELELCLLRFQFAPCSCLLQLICQGGILLLQLQDCAGERAVLHV